MRFGAGRSGSKQVRQLERNMSSRYQPFINVIVLAYLKVLALWRYMDSPLIGSLVRLRVKNRVSA